MKKLKDRKVKGIDFTNTESMTEQSHLGEVSMQRIMSKYRQTGMITHLNKHAGTYDDLATAPDYLEAMRIIAEANSTFESIPADIRAEFDNRPDNFLSWIQDENNRDEILELGFDVTHLPPLPEPETAPAPASVPAPEGDAHKQVDIEDD